MDKFATFIKELEQKAHKKECANEPKPKCEYCEDTGIITRTEWTGTDDSHDVEEKCVCTED